MAQITQILLFSGMSILEKSKITVWERHLFKKSFRYGSFRNVPTLRKEVFSGASVKRVFLYSSNNSDSVAFGNAGFAEIKDHSLRTTPFQKKFCYGSFRHVTTLRKKVFSGAPVKCFFLYGWNNPNSVVFKNSGFGEIKDHSLCTIDFLKVF